MNQTIDGINNVDRQIGTPINKFRIADAVQEFSVTTTVAGADVGPAVRSSDQRHHQERHQLAPRQRLLVSAQRCAAGRQFLH